MSSAPRTGGPAVQEPQSKKKKTSERKSERVGATTGGEKIREETMRDVWTGEWSGRDTRQRSGAQRGKEKNR